MYKKNGIYHMTKKETENQMKHLRVMSELREGKLSDESRKFIEEMGT